MCTHSTCRTSWGSHRDPSRLPPVRAPRTHAVLPSTFTPSTFTPGRPNPSTSMHMLYPTASSKAWRGLGLRLHPWPSPENCRHRRSRQNTCLSALTASTPPALPQQICARVVHVITITTANLHPVVRSRDVHPQRCSARAAAPQ